MNFAFWHIEVEQRVAFCSFAVVPVQAAFYSASRHSHGSAGLVWNPINRLCKLSHGQVIFLRLVEIACMTCIRDGLRACQIHREILPAAL